MITDLLPTIPGKVSGIVGWEPLKLQCHDCGEIHEQCCRSAATCIILSGFHFHTCEGKDGVRRCPSCLAAVIKACPNRVCKEKVKDRGRQSA